MSGTDYGERHTQVGIVRVLQVVPSFYPAHGYGGAVQSVYRLSCHLARHGHEVKVLTTDANGRHRTLETITDREVQLAETLHVRYCRRMLAESVSPRLLRLLPAYIDWAEIVHLTAVYSFPTIPTLLLCKVKDRPLVWSPRGSFQRWSGSTRSFVKMGWEWVCRLARPRKLALHATSEEEALASAERSGVTRTEVISNGVDVPDPAPSLTDSGVLRLLYLGRLDAKKGIENLLMACKIFQDQNRVRWSLTIAGSGDQRYVRRLCGRIDELALLGAATVVGHVDGDAKRTLFENADIVVLPSYTENFGLVVGEALAHGVPVIASRGTPWRRIEEVGCGLWVDNDPESIAQAITRMAKMPLRVMGQRGREWMANEFSWDRQAVEMLALYQRLIA